MDDRLCLIANRQTGDLRLVPRIAFQDWIRSGWVLVVTEPDDDTPQSKQQGSLVAERVVIRPFCGHTERLPTCPPSEGILNIERCG
jgi:hypothetical protein